MLEAVGNLIAVGWSIYLEAGFWVVLSLLAGGLLHTFVPQESFKRWLGKTSFSSIALATGIGAVLPICSCGVVPLGLTMYWSGASLAASVAFMVATPIINPAAALMSFGLLGPELAIIYIAAGLGIPPAVAYASRLLAPDLQYSARTGKNSRARALRLPLAETRAGEMTNFLTRPAQSLGSSSAPAAAAPALPRLAGSAGCT